MMNMAETDDDKILVSRIIDVLSAVEEKNIVRNSQFLNGHEINLAKKVALEFNVAYDFYGGYNDAERRMIVAYPDYLCPQDEDIPIKVILAKTKSKSRLSHRDYMGAVLNLGIKREKIGDIVVCDDCGYIFCTEDIADYIVSQIEKIGNSGVVLSVCDFNNITVPPKKFKEISDSVSSIRLDALVSVGAGISRADALLLIQRGCVSVNWEIKEKPDFKPCEGDMLSVHGFGRILFYKIGGTSKKGRIFVTLRRFI